MNNSVLVRRTVINVHIIYLHHTPITYNLDARDNNSPLYNAYSLLREIIINFIDSSLILLNVQVNRFYIPILKIETAMQL